MEFKKKKKDITVWLNLEGSLATSISDRKRKKKPNKQIAGLEI